jgi:hypothetical protein
MINKRYITENDLIALGFQRIVVNTLDDSFENQTAYFYEYEFPSKDSSKFGLQLMSNFNDSFEMLQGDSWAIVIVGYDYPIFKYYEDLESFINL